MSTVRSKPYYSNLSRRLSFVFVGSILVTSFSTGFLNAVEIPEITEGLKSVALRDKEIEESVGPIKRSPDQADIYTRPDARVMTLSIPSLRGQIVDRYGNPLAQNKTVWYPALKYPQFENADRKFIVSWGRQRVNKANEIFGVNWAISDEELWQHYRHRRWMAMPYTHVVDAKRKKLLESKMVDGLVFHPIYQRYYPEGKAAAHIIGYVGSKGKLEKGPINYGDPIFEYTVGRSGLEKLFDKQLRGEPGLLQLQYDSNGNEILREQKRAPKQGVTLVTTLDLKWQKRAERVLRDHTRRGALVILDIQTGEVVAMASRPSYDLNTFVPFISNEDYSKLRDDPETPLFSRAFQAEYPPASTIKPVIALAGLKKDVIEGDTLLDCPAYIQLGRHKMYNWSRKAEGKMDVVKAMYRSNNPYFIKVGLKVGSASVIDMARRLGYGSKTNLPLIGESDGLLPSDEYMLKHHNRRIASGLPKLQLVRQVQDARGRVLAANQEEDRTKLGVSPSDVASVHEGMMKVVNISAGTGKAAALNYTIVCGKTGTAQWGPKGKKQYLGWFAGFFPLDKPKYAFAMVYEGKPGESVSGGKQAAPMVKSFFGPISKEVKYRLNPPSKALIVEEENSPVAEAEVKPVLGEETPVVPLDLPPPKAILVEEEGEEGIPPLRNLPESVEPDTGTIEEEPTEGVLINPRQNDGVIEGAPLRPLESEVVEEPDEEPEPIPDGPPKAIPIEE